MYCNVCDSAISIAVNYCINPNIKAFFLPRYTYTKVPDFLGTSLLSRLPDSLDHGKQKSLLLRLFDSRLYRSYNDNSTSRFLLSFKIIQIWLSPSGDKLKKLWENGNLGGGASSFLTSWKVRFCIWNSQPTTLDIGGRPSSTNSIRNLSIRIWERATTSLWN